MKTPSLRTVQGTAIALFGLCLLLGASPGRGAGGGLHLTLPEAQWEDTLKELRKAKTNRSPYQIDKRTRSYDHEITIITPYTRAARFVQSRSPKAPPPAYEEVMTAMAPGRLDVELRVMHRSKEEAEGTLLMLAAGEQNIQPYQDKLITSFLKAVGFYAEPFYVAVKSFAFDLAKIPLDKAPEVVIIETDGSFVRVPIRWDRLR